MGNKVTATFILSTFLFAAFAAFIIPSVAAAGRGDGPGSFASSIIDMVNKRLCERQEKLSSRLPVNLVHPWKCKQEPPPPADVSVEISAEPETISEGDSSTLSWSSENADSCEASGGWDGDVATDGEETVAPTQTTTYTITCEGEGGSDSDSVTVTVEDEPEAPTVEITADPMTITEGVSSELTWNSENADTCTASNGWSGDKSVDGMQTVSPATTTTYAIECEGDGGTAHDSVTVTVNAAEPDTATLTLVKNIINDDEGTAEADDWTLVADGPTDISGVTGSAAVTNAVVTVGSYTLSETGGPGGYTASIFVCQVNDGFDETGNTIVLEEGETAVCTITNNDNDVEDDPTVEITASRTTVFEGSAGEATTTLSWDSTNATSCVASNGWSGTKAVDGSETVTPSATTTYAIECTGPGGTAQDSVTVNFVEEEQSTSGNLLISEVMYDNGTGQGSEPGNEWVELHNGTGQALNLSGYSLTDTIGASSTIPDGTTLAAGQFLIITGSSTTADLFDIAEGAVVVVLDGEIGNGLGNTGDSILLRNNEGSAVDEVSWGTDTNAFSPAAPDAPAGQTIGRVNINVDTGSGADWQIQTPNPGL